MGTLTFKVDERLKSIVQHAAESKEHRKAFGERSAKAALWLVHDAGVYLMSNGAPMQRDPQHSGPSEKALVQYARGCGDDAAGWERSRAIVGGDDFVEPLDLAFFQQAIALGRTTIKVRVTASQLELLS